VNSQSLNEIRAERELWIESLLTGPAHHLSIQLKQRYPM